MYNSIQPCASSNKELLEIPFMFILILISLIFSFVLLSSDHLGQQNLGRILRSLKREKFFQGIETGAIHQTLQISKILLPVNGVILLVIKMCPVQTQHLEDAASFGRHCRFVYRICLYFVSLCPLREICLC